MATGRDPPEQPTLRTADGRRDFVCFPAAILGFIINDRNEILLLSHPARKGTWEVVNGAVEAGESPLEALWRETREEAGPMVQIRPVGVVHTFQYPFDAHLRSMLSIAYAATYLGGDIEPGGDMTLSNFRWASLSEIEGGLSVLVPTQTWLFQRAVAVHSLLKHEEVQLEPWQSLDVLRDGRSAQALAAVMVTDLVESTSTAVRMGDAGWLSLLQQHHRMAHAVTTSFRGRIVKSTGDGVLGVFASVIDAVAASKAIQSNAGLMDLVVRAGVHVGEVTPTSVDIAGRAVVVATRICSIASGNELLVSGVAADLLAGSIAQLGRPRRVALKGLGEMDVVAATIESSSAGSAE